MSAYPSLHSRIGVGSAVAVGSGATVVGPAFDTQGFEEFLGIYSRNLAGGVDDADFVIEHSDDEDGVPDPYSAIPGTEITMIEGASLGDTVIGRVVINANIKRYVRISLLGGGGDILASGCIIGVGVHDKPTTLENTLAYELDETAN